MGSYIESSFFETTLFQESWLLLFKVKVKHSYVGGPAYYMERGLKKRWMGVLFAVLITVTFGLAFNSVQGIRGEQRKAIRIEGLC